MPAQQQKYLPSSTNKQPKQLLIRLAWSVQWRDAQPFHPSTGR
jgi:hypothetical protein